jgi:adenylyl-sulfate kinase
MWSCIWLTGLPGAGKSTLAKLTKQLLEEKGRSAVVIDADEMRTKLNRDLSFSRRDRRENVRRIAEVARMFSESGQISIVACISPYMEDRSMARQILTPHGMVEVFVSAPAEVCKRRDPKGLYAQAAQGRISGLVGHDVDYEPPIDKDAEICTDAMSPLACAQAVLTRFDTARATADAVCDLVA